MAYKYLIFILLLSLTTTVNANDIRINSIPSNAEIWIRPLNNQNFVKIGETPYKNSIKDIMTNFSLDKMFVLEIRKPEHQSYRILLNDFTNADIDLEAKLQITDEYELMNKVDETSQGMFEVQRLIRTKNYDQALIKVEELLKRFPRLSILHELKGSIYYLMNRKVESLDAYREAFKNNPKNQDAYKMKEYLEKSITDGRENEKTTN